ncbi:MAG: hypothetical protein M1830_008469 [Pleopsidium flavum]|nr:MAG: hypothetical protein M1830_008469 [Pleopsidium flavum]
MAPPTKRRKKSATAVEEITFDPSAREDYLTGFHKRKVQRIKHAQLEAAKKERQERIIERKRMREQRKAELEKHVETVNAMLREADGGISDTSGEESGTEMEEWNGVAELPEVDHEAEYIDEDRYTTVTVEAMDLSREGLHRAIEEEERVTDVLGDENRSHKTNGSAKEASDKARKSKRIWTKENPEGLKKKKKKFRYESKAERKVTRYKERSGNKAKARARKE